MAQRVVPEEAGGGVGERVGLVLAHAVGVAARPAGEGALQVVGADRGRAPLVAVGAEDAGAVGVVEQDELAGELVLVGGDPLAEDAQARVAVARRDVAQHLVVGAVLLDHVDDVLDRGSARRSARARRGRAGRGAAAGAPRRCARAGGCARPSRSARGSSRVVGQRHERERAVVVVRVEAGGAGGRLAPRRSGFGVDGVALDVGDAERPAGGVEDERAGKPADGDEAPQLRLAVRRVERDDGRRRSACRSRRRASGRRGRRRGRSAGRRRGRLGSASPRSSRPRRRVRVSMTLRVSLAAFAQTTWRPSGETASALAWRPVTTSASAFPLARSITVTDPSLAMCSHRVHLDLGAAPGGAGEVALRAGDAPPQFET